MIAIGSCVKSFLSEEDGQDTMEYTLLLGFVALAAADLSSRQRQH